MNTMPEATVACLWGREMKMEEGGSDRGRTKMLEDQR